MSGIPERVWKLKLPCHVDNAIMKHMETIIKKIDRNQIDQVIMEEAGSILKNGGLVAFPTETVYGLGANALDEEAAKKTYAAKGRPSDNPLIVHIARLEDLGAIVESVPLIVDEIAAHFWPGPLTMIFNKNEKVPLGTTGGLETVAVRMPDDEIARELILAGGGYVSAPSANTSGRPSPTTAQHVAEDLSGKIEMILDGGSVDIGVESTILDMTVTPPMILRPGAITKEMLSEVIGEVAVDETLISENSTKAPKAPGMKYRHYAPKAEMIIVDGEPEEAVRAIKQIAYEQVRLGYKVGIIASNESVDQYTTGVVKCIGSRVNEKTVARNLYKVLREFDEEEVDYIYSEAFPEAGIGTAIMNRLGKAAGHHVLQASEITKLQDYRRIVFVSNSANCRAPIAAAILKKQPLFQEYEVCARGLVVLFPEPLNPRAEELLARHHIETEGYETVALSEEEFGEDTLVLAMQDSIKQKIQNDYPGKGQVYTLCEFVNGSKEVPSVYGQTQEQYEQMYELIQGYVKKLANKFKRGGQKTNVKCTRNGSSADSAQIGIIRREETGSKDFRMMIGEIAMLMCYEATRDLKLQDVEIQTPICKMTAKELAGKKLAVVPILRAGLGMVEGMLAMIPAAKVGHIGLFRDPETLEPVEYYCKLPADCEEREVFVVDPMLATGGSCIAAIQMLKNRGVKNIRFMCIIAAPEGVKKLQEAHPDVEVYIGALDEKLNEHGYIVPGLGDAGDRIFGTK